MQLVFLNATHLSILSSVAHLSNSNPIPIIPPCFLNQTPGPKKRFWACTWVQTHFLTLDPFVQNLE